MQYFEERDGKLIFRYNGETVPVSYTHLTLPTT